MTWSGRLANEKRVMRLFRFELLGTDSVDVLLDEAGDTFLGVPADFFLISEADFSIGAFACEANLDVIRWYRLGLNLARC